MEVFLSDEWVQWCGNPLQLDCILVMCMHGHDALMHACQERMRGDAIVSATSAPRPLSNACCLGHAGFFILGYCFYYYFARSEMSGFMQTAFYFGYMAMVRQPCLHANKHTSPLPACFSAPASLMTRLVSSLRPLGLGSRCATHSS